METAAASMKRVEPSTQPDAPSSPASPEAPDTSAGRRREKEEERDRADEDDTTTEERVDCRVGFRGENAASRAPPGEETAGPKGAVRMGEVAGHKEAVEDLDDRSTEA